MRLESLAVFCGSREGARPAYAAAARALGEAMAARGVRLVYGGGSIGLMGVVADAVLGAGGLITGVIPHFLDRLEVGHAGLDELVRTDNMHERKRIMFDRADAFVTLPGGLGTLDETLEILTWRQLGLHAKPVMLLNTDGYWDPMLSMLEAVVSAGFASPPTHDLYDVVATPDALFATLDALPEPPGEKRADRV